MNVKIFLTGAPGSGKTRLALAVMNELKKAGKRVAGVISPEVRRNGKRWGFKIVDLASRTERVLASVEEPAGPRVSRYRVNVSNIDAVVASFEESWPTADIVLIDEIGKMELYSEAFAAMVERILRSDKAVIGVVHRALANRYGRRGKLFWLTKANWERTKEEVLALLCESAKRES
ncbi:MAG: NTPase [Candidatus Aenigmatarchaeota archaeon]